MMRGIVLINDNKPLLFLFEINFANYFLIIRCNIWCFISNINIKEIIRRVSRYIFFSATMGNLVSLITTGGSISLTTTGSSVSLTTIGGPMLCASVPRQVNQYFAQIDNKYRKWTVNSFSKHDAITSLKFW
jgi:hypothetical protein